MTRSVQAVGIIEPLLVSPNDDGTYTVIAGHRRHAAAQAAALATVPCVVRAISELEAVELALIENGQRHDLNPIEEAEGYYRLFEAGRSLTDMAATLGRSAKHISGRLALLELPKKAQRALEQSTITLGDAEALLDAREHPDLIEAVIDARRDANGHFDLRRGIEQALRERHRDEAVAALTERATERGLTLVEHEGYNPSGYRTVKDQLGFDTNARRQHRKQPCHAVTIETTWDGRAELVEVCTDWKRHTTRTKKHSAGREADTAEVPDPEQERQAARRHWVRRRGEFLTSVLGGRVNKTVVVDAALRTLIEEARANASRRAAQLLGLAAHDEHGYESWNRALVEHASENGVTLVQVAAAVSAAHGEETLRGGYRQAPTYQALLQALGYQPDDGEFPADGSSGEPPAPAA